MRSYITRIAMLGACALGLTGCPDDTVDPGTPGETTPDMSVVDSTCAISDDCTGPLAGQQCIDGECVDCTAGELDCVCRANGTCCGDLRCDETTALCAPCAPGEESCPCDDGACAPGLACQGDVCLSDTCTPGALDCPCDNGSCENMPETFCDEASVCRGCTSDIPGCACDIDDTCLGDNFCDTDRGSVCAACPASDRPIDCTCGGDDDCATGLVCDMEAGRCRAKRTCTELCVPNQECDASGAGDPVCVFETCLDGFDWDAETGMCVETVPLTCDGRDGSMDLSLECARLDEECVEVAGEAICVKTCASIGEACAQENRDCEAAALRGDDAVCGVCQPGFEEDGSGACVPNPQANCSPIQNPDAIAATCRARNQVCEAGDMGGATCGACLDGFTFDPARNGCTEKPRCGGTFCGDDEFCEFPQTGGPPSCVARSCAAGEALDDSGSCITCSVQCDAEGVYPVVVDGACACASEVFCSYQFDGSGSRCTTTSCASDEAEDPSGQCISCSNLCGAQEGERARLWPVTTVSGECVCETQEGFYRPFGGASRPLACDADRDGWINRTAKGTFDAASNITQGAITEDEAVLANFRCDLRVIDRFTLKNEWGQERHVSVCKDDMIDYAPGSPHGCTDVDGLRELVLFESDALDDDVVLTNDPTSFPRYGSRPVRAAEVNALTKLCVSPTGDFNDNSVEDLDEQQPLQRQRLGNQVDTTTDEGFAFASVSYFAELHRGYYVPPVNFGLPGSYVVEERSRCDVDFPLGTVDGASGYWQNCSRNRRGDYLFSGSHNGHDFAHYSCSGEASGSCAMPEPPLVTPTVDADNDRIPDHGLCDQTGPLANEPWRGMAHHSQFQCVVVKDSPTDPDRDLSRDDLYAAADTEAQVYDFNDCTLNDCSAGQANCRETTGQGEYQPEISGLTCIGRERGAVSNDQVGWVTVRYLSEASNATLARPYIRGCYDESFGLDGTNGWEALCPGQQDNPDAILAAGNPGDSGKLICSCNLNYGGANCESGCKERTLGPDPTRFLHVGAIDRGYEVSQLQEFACDPNNNYCSLHPPAPADGFNGGRRGYWLCGDTSLTLTLDSSGATAPTLDGSATVQGATKSYELRAGVKITPVVRQPMEFTGQVGGQTKTYSLF